MNIKGFGNLPVNDYKAQQSSGKEKAVRGDTVARPSEESKPESARVELSAQARDLKAIEKSLADLPEVDQSRVEALKQQIQSGNYTPNSQKVAEKLLGFEGNL